MPKITPQSLQALKDRIDIVDIIGHYVKLKKKGSNQEGLCPFHNEKSPSFTVSAAKGLYKCFGCGKSGDAIGFVVDHDKLTFIEAVESIAAKQNFSLEYEQETPQKKQQRQQDVEDKQLMQLVTNLAQDIYTKQLFAQPKDSPVWQYLTTKRELTDEMCQFWGIGFAPDAWQTITTPIINKKLYPAAKATNLVGTTEGRTWDVYRNRITIPLHNTNGYLIGIAARHLPTGNKEVDDKQAKYLNPPESLLYNKSAYWYGLYQAITAKAFAPKNGITPPAIITEGYFDVISMHECGATNTICCGGTSITPQHIQQLKKYTSHFIIYTDGDEAGKKSALRLIDDCITENIRVEIIETPGKDPDEFARQYKNALKTTTT